MKNRNQVWDLTKCFAFTAFGFANKYKGCFKWKISWLLLLVIDTSMRFFKLLFPRQGKLGEKHAEWTNIWGFPSAGLPLTSLPRFLPGPSEGGNTPKPPVGLLGHTQAPSPSPASFTGSCIKTRAPIKSQTSHMSPRKVPHALHSSSPHLVPLPPAPF